MAYVSANPMRFAGKSVASGQCVAFVQAATQVGHTGRWRRGEQVRGANLAIGTAIATFDEKGRYINDTRLVLAIALLGMAFPALAAPVTACPPEHRDGKHTGSLETASVFDGPPRNLVDLMPDLATSEWDLSMGQEHARARGDSMYLVCRYKRIKATVTLKIPYEATICKVEGGKKRTYVSCSAPHKNAGTTSQ